MRVKRVRLFAMAAFFLFVHLGMAACSSSQEGQGDEVTVDETNQEGGNEAAAQGDAGNDAVSVEGDNAAAAEAPAGAENTAPVEDNMAVADSQATTTDGEMQDIINSGAADQAAAPAEAAPADAVPAEAAPADAVAAVPAPAEAVPAAAPVAAPAEGAPAAAPVAAAVAGVGIPEMGSKMPYIVQPGDTLGKIAGKIYGDQTKWKQIADLSNVTNPNRIYPGDVVYYQLTQEAVAFATSYESAPRAEIQAASGDTLFNISSKVLGSPMQWRSIWRENGHIDSPDQISAGTTVYYVDHGAVKSAMEEVKSANSTAQVEAARSDDFAGALIAFFSSMS